MSTRSSEAAALDELDTIARLTEENRSLRLQIRRLKKKTKPEFSKIIFTAVSAVTAMVTAFTCIMVAVTRDTSALCYLIPAVFAEMASATGFYYSKAKAENKIKLMKAYGITPEASSFDSN